jgi:signal transduction histidine kinase
MRWLVVGFCIAVCALKTIGAHAGEALTLPGDIQPKALSQFAEVATDVDGSWSIGTATTAQFHKLERAHNGFLKNGAIWMRVAFVNTSATNIEVVLDTGDFAQDRVDLFLVDTATKVVLEHAQAGSEFPLSRREIKSHTIAFPLTLPAQRAVEVYMRTQIEARIRIAPALYSPAAFREAEHRYDMIAYGCYGGLLALILYHLIVMLFSRDWESMHFIVFMLAWGAYSALLEGLLLPLLPAASPLSHSGYWSVTAVIPITAMAVLIIRYLKPQQIHPAYRWILLGICTLVTVAAIATVKELAAFPFLRIVTILCVQAMIITCIVICAILAWRGHATARFYLLAAVMMLIFIERTIYIFMVSTDFYVDVNIWLRLSYVSPLLLFAVGHGQRINELKLMHIESVRRAAQALEQNEFKSNFLAKMSHEIRTPMNGVLAPVDLLRHTPLSAEQAKYVDIIGMSGNTLLEVVNGILDYSKLEAGKLHLVNAPFALRKLIAECAAMFSVHPKLTAVKFAIDIADDVPEIIDGDAHRLRQVLINLIGNAFKFTAYGSIRLVVRAGAKLAPDIRIIEMAVIDSGIGISAEDVQNLFAEYHQARANNKTSASGTGLGLAICKQLVELMHGSIAVNSKPEQGSTFSFQIPLRVPVE